MSGEPKSHQSPYIHCSEPECEAKVPDHYWGKVKKGSGWFFSRDGEQAWCPDHLPEWVGPWRAEQNAKRERAESGKA